jgi:hypothetical protein
VNSIILFLVLAAFTHLFASMLIHGAEGRWVKKSMLIAWFSLFPLLALTNLWFPFNGGGDDRNYYEAAARTFNSFADFFDLTQFFGLMEQPGYAWLLSILYQFSGQDLIAFKLLNLAFFLMLMPLWYRIGADLESKRFGRAMVLAIPLLTTLWYYWMFMLKDIIITLLQSMFLLGAVQISRTRGKGGWLFVLAATLALIPFRSQLVLVNMGVLAGFATLMSIRQGHRIPSLTLVLSVIMITCVLGIASNPEWMAKMGIYAEHRVIGSEAAMNAATLSGEHSPMKRALFPLLYLFSETAALSPQSWVNFNSLSLRGVLALPWILVAVPFFVLGLISLMRRNPQGARAGSLISRIRSSRAIATPWGGVLVFILISMTVSWTVGDTTRWRIPDMPAIAAVATAGWMSMGRQTRVNVLLLWIAFAGMSFGLNNLIKGV